MKICLLSRNPTLYSTKRLAEVAEKRGHRASCVDYLRCYVEVSKTPRVMYAGQPLQEFDAVIPRVASGPEAGYGAAIVRQFEMMGVLCLNASQGISRAGDKLRSLQLLSRLGIDLPRTTFAHPGLARADALAVVGAPCVIKLLHGNQGAGVVLAQNRAQAEAVISSYQQLGASYLVQEFIAEAEGKDLRAFVVGGKVVAAMERSAPPGDFRSNLHRGGKASKVTLSKAETRLAVAAAKAMNLEVAGVDLIRAKRGPLVLEVNASPGFEGIEAATGIDIAGKIVGLLESLDRKHKRARVDA